MKDVKVVQLNAADEEDEGYQEFLETLREDNESVVFIVSKKDGTMSIGSTAKDPKDLLWECHRLQMFMQELVRGVE